MRTSVVMAAYNAEAYVAQAIESLLDQSRPADEIIVVNDGSNDGTRGILDRFATRITCVSQAQHGLTVARNRGISIANGEVLGFLDADDLWCRTKLEQQLRLLESSSDIEAVFGRVRQFISPDVPEGRRPALTAEVEASLSESAGSMLIRRAAFDRIGPFDETFRMTGFIEWLGRAKRMGLRSIKLDEVVALRRLHLANGGRLNTRSQDQETLLALKHLIDARRPPH